MRKEDLVCLIVLAGAGLYVGAHVVFALLRTVLPVFAQMLAR